MIAVIQRVDSAHIETELDGSKTQADIGCGIVILLGIDAEDTEADMKYLCEKCRGLRIFCDGDGKMNLSVDDIGGQALIISNFTLCADTSHGKRPSFIGAARPEKAKPLYDDFVKAFSAHTPVKTGVFGAHMEITMKNNGPVTLIINSRQKQ